MFLPIIVFTTIAAVILTWRMLIEYSFSNQVKHLFSTTANSGKVFHEAQLEGLPEPVQRHFRHVMKNGQRYVSKVNLEHKGWFKRGIGKTWTAIKGEEYFATNTPEFIWKGKTALFTAVDRYMGGKGSLKVFILSVIRVVNGSGKKYDQGELSRWLSESVWFPTSLLPTEHLNWIAVDETAARLLFSANGRSVQFLVTFNEANEIAQMETRRFMGEEKLEAWVTKMSNYEERNGMKIPIQVEALWRLATGDFSYARFQVTNIQYNVSN